MTNAEASGLEADHPADSAPAVIVPEIRDYTRINAELVRLLDDGHRRVRLSGVDGHRLLAFGIRGSWKAIVDVEGSAGPELAAEMDAPNLAVICAGHAASGAGRSLRSGILLICGDAGPGLGYVQQGGNIVVAGDAAPRAGLDQKGGLILVGGSTGRLPAERQAGGRMIVRGSIGAHARVGHRGGRLCRFDEATTEDLVDFERIAEVCGPAWPESLPIGARIR